MSLFRINSATYDYSQRIMKAETDDNVNQIQTHKIKQTAPITEEEQTQAEDSVKLTNTYDARLVNEKKSNPQDFTFDFQQRQKFNLASAQNKPENLDAKKLLSDLQRDDVLKQYTYFVQPDLGSDEDGTVRQIFHRK